MEVAMSRAGTRNLLTVDPATGHLALSRYPGVVRPRMELADFATTLLAQSSDCFDQRIDEWGEARFELPPSEAGDAWIWTQLWFNHWRLESVWLRPAPPGTEPEAPSLGEGHEPDRLKWQAEVLARHVGCPDGTYPWGTVWNRYNIHTQFFDVSIVYAVGREGD